MIPPPARGRSTAGSTATGGRVGVPGWEQWSCFTPTQLASQADLPLTGGGMTARVAPLVPARQLSAAALQAHARGHSAGTATGGTGAFFPDLPGGTSRPKMRAAVSPMILRLAR